MKNSIWVLYKSFFDTVPGQKGLLAIGFLLMVLGCIQQETRHAELSITAGAAFLTAFTLLFAGPHFRQLASLRRHRLLPNFRKHLITSYLMALASLSLFLLVGLMLLEKQHTTPLIQLENMSTVIIWLSLLGLIFITSLLGFLPGYLRYPVWLLLIFGVANVQHFNTISIEFLLSVIIGIAITALFCFIYFFGIINKPILYTKRTISLSKYLPGLNGDFQDRSVTAVGSILLGMSDSNSSRFLRAFFTTFFIPMAFTCSVLLTGKYSAEQHFKNPLFLLISLMTGVMVQIHFAFTVSAKRRFIWLRIGGNRQQINQLAQKILAKERWTMAFCYALWCVPVVALYPPTTSWLLGVSTFLWFMMLLLEQIILGLKVQLSRRAEFYMLLIFMGAVIGVIALANVHQQPGILWCGVAVMLVLYLAQKLYSIFKHTR